MIVNIVIFLFNYKTIYGYKNMENPFVQYFLPPDFKFEKREADTLISLITMDPILKEQIG